MYGHVKWWGHVTSTIPVTCLPLDKKETLGSERDKSRSYGGLQDHRLLLMLSWRRHLHILLPPYCTGIKPLNTDQWTPLWLLQYLQTLILAVQIIEKEHILRFVNHSLVESNSRCTDNQNQSEPLIQIRILKPKFSEGCLLKRAEKYTNPPN